jgi:hypothetical protein
MFLLVGGVADAGERLVESKLLEWFRSGVVPWCSDRDWLLLVCDGQNGVGPGSGVEEAWRAPSADVSYWDRSSLTGLVAIAVRQRLMARGFFSAKQWTNFLVLFFSDIGEGYVCLVVAVMILCSSTTVCILLILCCLYAYQIYTVIFINTSNVYLRERTSSKKKELPTAATVKRSSLQEQR